MQVSLENLGKLERKLTVRFPAEQVESRVRQRVSEMSRNARIKGFRPGKVPVKVIEQRFGAQIRNEALSDVVGSTFREAVQQEKLQPVAMPNIDTDGKPQDGEIAYVATFEVLPEMPAIDVSNLQIERGTAQVGDADIDAMIETLRAQRRTFENVDRAAQAGDMVIFEYSAQAGDYRYPEAGRERAGTVLGSGALFAAFEEILINRSAGDEFDAAVAFPVEFRNPQLAGKLVQVGVRVEKAQAPQLPEVDARFIQSFGIGEGDVETFRKEVRANLERELDNALHVRLRNEVAKQLVDAYPELDVPQVLVDAEAQRLVRASAPGMPADAPVPPEAIAAAQPAARRRVAAGLLLREIGRVNDIRPDNKRVSEAVAAIASTYEEPQKVVELYANDPQMLDGVRTSVLEDQVAEWVADHATATEKALSFDEVMHPR
ncbi:MAG TPA: trigger factor [Rhodanobacteraceae bacterium]|nr:trigger factor [Rhodanobacteraceae bacterium]